MFLAEAFFIPIPNASSVVWLQLSLCLIIPRSPDEVPFLRSRRVSDLDLWSFASTSPLDVPVPQGQARRCLQCPEFDNNIS